ncbi:MAG: hypothetical protein ACRDOI_19505 [Trebonia sp.]
MRINDPSAGRGKVGVDPLQFLVRGSQCVGITAEGGALAKQPGSLAS